MEGDHVYVFRTYNHEYMLIYSQISTQMSIILAVTNDIDIEAPRSSLNVIGFNLRHMCGL